MTATTQSVTLLAPLVAVLARAKEARDVGHQAVEAAFTTTMSHVLLSAGVPEGVEFQIEQHEDGTATVTYAEPAAPSLLVSDAEGAE